MKKAQKNSGKKSKNGTKETLTKREHNLLVEGYKSKELENVYDDLNDLELADLSDFFEFEGGNGSGI